MKRIVLLVAVLAIAVVPVMVFAQALSGLCGAGPVACNPKKGFAVSVAWVSNGG